MKQVFIEVPETNVTCRKQHNSNRKLPMIHLHLHDPNFIFTNTNEKHLHLLPVRDRNTTPEIKMAHETIQLQYFFIEL